MTFTIDGQAQTPVSLSVVGGVDQAQFVTSTLAAGQHSVTAAYSGETNVSPAAVVADADGKCVNAVTIQPTITTLTSSMNPSTVGQQVTFTAVVTHRESPEHRRERSRSRSTACRNAGAGASFKRPRSSILSISTLAAGMHTVSAAYGGSASLREYASPAFGANGRRHRPRATHRTLCQCSALVSTCNRRSVVLTFSSALDPTTAEDVRNYQIVGPAGRRIAIKSAVYDPTTNTVTLHPIKKINLHHNYQLTVMGSGPGNVASVFDTLLDGAGDGDSGSNYVATLNWKNVVLTPSESLKLHAQSHAKPGGVLAHRFLARKR